MSNSVRLSPLLPLFPSLRNASRTILKASIAALLAGGWTTTGSAQMIRENFDDISLLSGKGWVLQNNSVAVGSTNWFQGSNVGAGGPFDAQQGAANSYIGANYNNTGNTGTISNWLEMPNVTLYNGDVLTFYTRKPAPDSYADRLELRLSTNGASSNAGSGTSVGDFTTLLLSINPSLVLGVYPTNWTQYTVTISGLSAPVSGRLALRYFVTGGGYLGVSSDYIGIDTLNYYGTQRWQGGTGTWDTSTANWDYGAWGNWHAVFTGADTVSVGSTVSFKEIEFQGSSANTTLLGAGTLAMIGDAAISADLYATGGTGTINTTISGNGSLTKNGAGLVKLQGNNTYTGGTIFHAGAVEINNSNALGTGALTFSGGELRSSETIAHSAPSLTVAATKTGTISATTGKTFTLSPVDLTLQGTSNLVFGSTGHDGIVVLAPTGTVTTDPTATLSVNAGHLRAGNTALGQITAAAASTTVASDATLEVNDQQNSGAFVIKKLLGAGTLNTGTSSATVLEIEGGTFSGGIEGAGKFSKSTTDTLTLTGASAFTGTTTVSAGKLVVNNPTGSATGTGAVTIQDGATLGGTGLITGQVNIQSGGHLAPGNSPGTLGTGTLILESGSFTDFELGYPYIVGGGVNDLVNVTGDLTIDGTLNITDAGNFGTGVYRLFNFTGTFTDHGFEFGTIPNGYTAADDFSLQTTVAGQLNLVVRGGGFNPLFWDGNGPVSDGTVSGGSGTWSATGTNWAESTGYFNSPWLSQSAVFAGTGGTVTVDATGTTDNTLAFESIQFMDDGYEITSTGGSRLKPAAEATILVDGEVTATMSVGLTGTGRITKDNAGTLILTEASDYSGGTFVESGVLALAGSGSLKSDGTITINGGSFEFRDSTSAQAMTINNSSTLSFIDTATAASASIDNRSPEAYTTFQGQAVAGTAAITNSGPASFTVFNNTAQADHATINNLGDGSYTNFLGSSSAGAATITNTGLNATTYFIGQASGATARLINQSSTGVFDFTQLTGASTTAGSIEGPGSIVLGSKALIVGGNNLSTEFSGVISDGEIDGSPGALVKDGGGVLILGNNGGGTTTISNGPSDLLNVSIFASAIVPSTGGSLVKEGTGTLTLSGINTYTGDTTVNQGSLIVDGSIASPTTTVNAPGLLGGHGTIGGALINNGLVSPGNSPGTLTVAGNFTQSSSGMLKIEIAGRQAGEHDLLAVGGAAHLGGKLQLVRLNNFQLQIGDHIAFLTAAGGVSGKFAVEENEFATGTIVSGKVVYGAREVALEAFQESFVDVPGLIEDQYHFSFIDALSPNQFAVANALDNLVKKHGLTKLIEFLNQRRLTDLPGDFDRIAPEELTAIYQTAISYATIQSLNLQRRTDDLRSGSTGFSSQRFAFNGQTPSYSGGFGIASGAAGPTGDSSKDSKVVYTPTPDNKWGVFLSGTGEWIDVSGDGNARGYDVTTGGFTLGLDYKITPNLAVGLSAGYTGSSANLTDNGRVWTNGGKIGLYGTFFTGGFYTDLAVNGGYNSYDTKRGGLEGTARGSTEGGELNVLFGTGYDFKIGALTVGPTATFNYTYIGFDSYTEHGSLAPLHFRDQKAESMRTAFGLKASYDWKLGGVLIKPELRASWQHEFADDDYALDASLPDAGGNTFNVRGPKIGRDSLLLSGGVAVQLNDRVATYLYYDGQIARENYDSHSVTGGLRVSF